MKEIKIKRKKFTELKDRQSGYNSPTSKTLLEKVDCESGEVILDNKPYEDIVNHNETNVGHGSKYLENWKAISAPQIPPEGKVPLASYNKINS